MRSSQLRKLRTEIDDDPETRGYAGMTNSQIATDLRQKYVEQIRDEISRLHFLRDLDETEYTNLSAENKDRVWRILALPEIHPVGIVHDEMLDLFGNGSTTRAAWRARRKTTVTRYETIRIPRPTGSDVADAKALVL